MFTVRLTCKTKALKKFSLTFSSLSRANETKSAPESRKSKLTVLQPLALFMDSLIFAQMRAVHLSGNILKPYIYTDLLFLGNEWGLPLAIAANLHLPYRIRIGLEDLSDLHSIGSTDRCKYTSIVYYSSESFFVDRMLLVIRFVCLTSLCAFLITFSDNHNNAIKCTGNINTFESIN